MKLRDEPKGMMNRAREKRRKMTARKQPSSIKNNTTRELNHHSKPKIPKPSKDAQKQQPIRRNFNLPF